MQIDTGFRVTLPLQEAFALLTDLERVAPAMPGVSLEGTDGDELVANMRVKVGPVTAQYRMRVELQSEDAGSGAAVLRARGRELRGQGTVDATISASLRGDGDATDVTLHTDAAVTGKVAQFGRGTMKDVADRMLKQFAANLERELH